MPNRPQLTSKDLDTVQTHLGKPVKYLSHLEAERLFGESLRVNQYAKSCEGLVKLTRRARLECACDKKNRDTCKKCKGTGKLPRWYWQPVKKKNRPTGWTSGK